MRSYGLFLVGESDLGRERAHAGREGGALLPLCCCALGMIPGCGTGGPADVSWGELRGDLCPWGSCQLPEDVATSPLQVIY